MNLKKCLILLGCFILLSPISGNAQFVKRDIDWANFKRYHEANKKVEKPANVVFMGNSITDYWWGNHKEFFVDNHFICRGITAQTTSQMLVRFRKDVLDLQPRAVVILAGTNDIAGNNGYIRLDDILGNIVSMTELAQAHHIKVILCSILPSCVYGWNRSIEPAPLIIEFNKMLKEYCDNNKIPYVDYHSVMKDERNGLKKEWANDNVHPNLAGYKIMEDIILKEINKVLKKPYKVR